MTGRGVTLVRKAFSNCWPTPNGMSVRESAEFFGRSHSSISRDAEFLGLITDGNNYRYMDEEASVHMFAFGCWRSRHPHRNKDFYWWDVCPDEVVEQLASEGKIPSLDFTPVECREAFMKKYAGPGAESTVREEYKKAFKDLMNRRGYEFLKLKPATAI